MVYCKEIDYFHRMLFGSSKAIIRGLHYNDELKLSQKQKDEFAKLEVEWMYF